MLGHHSVSMLYSFSLSLSLSVCCCCCSHFCCCGIDYCLSVSVMFICQTVAVLNEYIIMKVKQWACQSSATLKQQTHIQTPQWLPFRLTQCNFKLCTLLHSLFCHHMVFVFQRRWILPALTLRLSSFASFACCENMRIETFFLFFLF